MVSSSMEDRGFSAPAIRSKIPDKYIVLMAKLSNTYLYCFRSDLGFPGKVGEKDLPVV
jgi:hypothetical protein